MREEKLMQSIRNATLEEVRKIATMVIKTSMDSNQKIEAITDKITALIERESEQKYTRKQVQKACAKAYQRGVDNRPYIEDFDEWVGDKDFETEVMNFCKHWNFTWSFAGLLEEYKSHVSGNYISHSASIVIREFSEQFRNYLNSPPKSEEVSSDKSSQSSGDEV